MLFSHPYPPGTPQFHSTASSSSIHLSHLRQNEEDWGWVRRLDELSQCMKDRRVFWGFTEGRINFPPSYRWTRGGGGGNSSSPSSSILVGGDDVDLEASESVSNSTFVNNEPENLAGDFTDMEKLQNAYTIAVVEKLPLMSRLIARASSWGSSYYSSSSVISRTSSISSSTAQSTGASSTASISSSNSTSSLYSQSTAEPPALPSNAIVSRRTPSYTDRILTHSLPGKAPNLRWRAYDMADYVNLSDHRPVAAAFELSGKRL